MKRITCAALALSLGSCTSDGPSNVPPGASMKGSVTFHPDGRAELDVEIGVNLAASGRARHFGLDGVRVEDFAGVPWTVDAVEFDESAWPITAEDEDAERRVLRVRAHATPSHPNELVTQVAVQLTGDEGEIEVFAGGSVTQVFEPCDDPTLGGVPDKVGAPIAWVVPTLQGLVSDISELTGDDAGSVWMAASSFTPNFGIPIMRLYRAGSIGLGSIQEISANYAAIATGADGSAVVTLGENDFSAWQIRRYDDAIDSLWSHAVGSDVPPIAAVSGGRVGVALRTFDDVRVDAISVAPAPDSGAVLAVFDEVSGEFVTSAELPSQATHVVRAGGGAFAIATSSGVQVLEADLTTRWSIDSSAVDDLESTADGDVWIAAIPEIFRYAPDGTLKHTYPLPSGGFEIAPRADGSVLVAGTNEVSHVDEAGNVNRVAFPVLKAPWCDAGVAFRIAPTGAGTAFSFVRATFEAPFAAYLGKLTP